MVSIGRVKLAGETIHRLYNSVGDEVGTLEKIGPQWVLCLYGKEPLVFKDYLSAVDYIRFSL